MAELSIKMTNQDNQVAAAIQEVSARSREAKGTFDQQVQAATEAAQAAVKASQAQATTAKQGQRLAESLTKQNEDLSQSYERQAASLRAAHDDGRISADQLKTSLGQLESQHSDMAAANRKAAHEASDAFKKQEADARAGIATVNRLEGETVQLGDQYKAMARQVKSAFDQGKISGEQYKNTLDRITAEYRAMHTAQSRTFDETAIGHVTKLAAGYLTVQTALSGVRLAIAEVQREMEKGKSATERLQDSRRNLLQVSTGDFAGDEVRADMAAVKHNVPRDVARVVLFSAKSEQFEPDYEDILSMDRLIPAEASARVAGQTNQIFGGQFSSRQIIGGVYVGAGGSRLNFQQMAEQLPQAAEGAMLAGSSAQETIGALGILSSNFNEAGQRIKILGTKIALNESTRGKGLIAGVETIMRMSDEERQDFIGGNAELFAVYDRFSKRIGEIKTYTAAIDTEMKATGSGNTLIDQRLAEADKDMEARRFRTSEQLGIASEIAAERKFSAKQSNAEGFASLNQLRGATGQQSGAETLAGSWFANVMSWGPGGQATDTGEKLEKALTEQTAILQKILERDLARDNAQQQPPALVTRANEDK